MQGAVIGLLCQLTSCCMSKIVWMKPGLLHRLPCDPETNNSRKLKNQQWANKHHSTQKPLLSATHANLMAL